VVAGRILDQNLSDRRRIADDCGSREWKSARHNWLLEMRFGPALCGIVGERFSTGRRDPRGAAAARVRAAEIEEKRGPCFFRDKAARRLARRRVPATRNRQEKPAIQAAGTCGLRPARALGASRGAAGAKSTWRQGASGSSRAKVASRTGHEPDGERR
jgi:hypothetical protein